jgi:hypothetical protein
MRTGDWGTERRGTKASLVRRNIHPLVLLVDEVFRTLVCVEIGASFHHPQHHPYRRQQQQQRFMVVVSAWNTTTTTTRRSHL